MERMEQKIKRLIRVAGKRTTAVVLALLMVVSMLPVVWPSVSAADYVCGLEEHTHSEECAEAACEKAEHAHTDSCYPAEEPDSEVTERVEAEKNIPVIPVSGSDAKDAVVSAGDVSGSDVSGSDIDLIEAFPVFAQSAAVDGVVVSVSAPIGVFPAGAELSVSKVSASTQSQVDALIGEADDSFTFDIKVLLDGEEIQPDTAYGEVSVRFSLDVPANAEVEVYHIDDGMTEADAMAPVVGDNSVAVVTDSFSVFTVTFTYGEDGTYELEWEYDKTNSVKLSEILAGLGVTDEVTAVTSSAADTVSAVQNGTDWDITMVKPFVSTSPVTLTVTTAGGDVTVELTSNLKYAGTSGTCSWVVTNAPDYIMTIFPTDGLSGTLEVRQSDPWSLGNPGWGWGAANSAIYSGGSPRADVKKVIVKPGVKAVGHTNYLFCFNSCKEIDINALDVSEVTDFSSTFSSGAIQNIDISNWDITNATTMNGMFNGTGIKSSADINFGDYKELPNLKSIKQMFRDCNSLTSFDFSDFNLDTRAVEDMSILFNSCDTLKSVNLTGLVTDNVTNMSSLFMYCEKLEEVNWGNINTQNVTNFSCMFTYCSSLPSIDLSKLDTSNGTDFSAMLANCSSLTELDLTSLNLSNATDTQAIIGTRSHIMKYEIPASWKSSHDSQYYNDYYRPPYYGSDKGHNVIKVANGTLSYIPDKASYYYVESVTIHDNGVDTVVNLEDYPESYPYFTGDMTATVIFGKPITITFKDSVDEAEIDVVSGIIKGTPFEVPDTPAHEGLEFLYWSAERNGETEIDLNTIGTDMTVWAVYGADITYAAGTDAPTAAADALPEADSVIYGTKYTAEAPEAITGYAFDGWYTDADCTAAFTDGTAIEKDTTLYGKWTVEQFTVTFKDSTDDSTIGEVTVDSNTAATAPAAPTHEDLEFVRWATEKNGETEADLTAVTEDMTVWAVYKEPRDSITGAPSVVFDKASKTFETNEEIKFKAVGFWADSTTTDFIDGDERYVPLNWHHADPSGDFGGKTAPTDTYTGSFKQSSAGTYTLKVEFRKYVYEDGAWVDKGIVTVDTQYKVTAPSGGSTIVPDTGDHGVSGTVALYVLQIAILSALLCVFSAKKLRKTGEAE